MKNLFEKALSEVYEAYTFPSDTELKSSIMERAKKMNKKEDKVRGVQLTEHPAHYSETKKPHTALNVLAGVAGTAAVLTGAVFGLNWLNEHGGLKDPDVRGQGAGYHEEIEPAQSEMQEADNDIVASEEVSADEAKEPVATLEYDDCTIVITDYTFDGLRLDLTLDYYPKSLKGGWQMMLDKSATNIGIISGKHDEDLFREHSPVPIYGYRQSYLLFSPTTDISVGFLTGMDNDEEMAVVERADSAEIKGINSDVRREIVKSLVHCTLPVNTEFATGVIGAPAWVEQPNGKSLKLESMYFARSVIMCVFPNVDEDIFDDWSDDIADMEIGLIGETESIRMAENPTPLHVNEEFWERSESHSEHFKFGDTIYMFYYSDREFDFDDVRYVSLGGKLIASKNADTDTFEQPSVFQSFAMPPEEYRHPLTDAHVETEKCDIDINWLTFDGMTLILQYDATFKDGLPDDDLLITPIWAFGDNIEVPYTTHGSRVDKLGVEGDTVSYICEIVYNRIMTGETMNIHFMDDHSWASEVFIPFDANKTGMLIITPEELPDAPVIVRDINKEAEFKWGKRFNVESATLCRDSVMLTIDCDTLGAFYLHDTYLVMRDGSRIDLDTLENKGGTGVENARIFYHFILSESIDPSAVKEIYVCGECLYDGNEDRDIIQTEEAPATDVPEEIPEVTTVTEDYSETTE